MPPIHINHLPFTQIQSFLRLIERDNVDLEELDHLSLPRKLARSDDMHAASATKVFVDFGARVAARSVVLALGQRRWREECEIGLRHAAGCEALFEADGAVAAAGGGVVGQARFGHCDGVFYETTMAAALEGSFGLVGSSG